MTRVTGQMNPKRRYRLLVAVIEAAGDRTIRGEKYPLENRRQTNSPFYFLSPENSLYIIAVYDFQIIKEY